MNKNISDIRVTGRCCGCATCSLVCPVGCISMDSDDFGFIVPEVNEAACIECSRCRSACPVNRAIVELSEHDWRVD